MGWTFYYNWKEILLQLIRKHTFSLNNFIYVKETNFKESKELFIIVIASQYFWSQTKSKILISILMTEVIWKYYLQTNGEVVSDKEIQIPIVGTDYNIYVLIKSPFY